MKKNSIFCNLKKITALLLCVVFLTACGGEESTTNSAISEAITGDDVSSSIPVSSEGVDDSVSEATSNSDTTFDESTDSTSDDVSSTSDDTEGDISESTSDDASDSASENTSDDTGDNTSTDASDDASESDDNAVTATYQGVQNFLTQDGSNKATFKYVFKVAGKTKRYSISDPTYNIQNSLKIGNEYKIVVEGTKLISAEPITEAPELFDPLISGTAGEKTLTNLIKTAFSPVGTTLYIYGGGWNWQDTGASDKATSIGVDGEWSKFFNKNNATFSYKNFYSKGWNEYNYAGLDCSGYIGWTIYNVANTTNGNEGYVLSSTKMAKNFSNKGWGTWSQKIGATPAASKGMLKPGDIVSKKGHVWMCVGMCDDGSIVILHSTPSESRSGSSFLGGGIQLSAVGNDTNCEAYALADRYMKTYYPEWYSRYPVVLKQFSDYTAFSGTEMGIFSWDTSGKKFMSDPDGIQSMSAEEVLEFIFKNVK